MKFPGIFLFAVLFVCSTLPPDFLSEQKKYKRVRDAIENKQSAIQQLLEDHNLTTSDLNILILATKENDKLEVFAKKKSDSTYKKVKTYEICSRSGKPGPKRKQGDLQVPEGFYYIDRFNPVSNFHLSLGINYPNLSDKRKSKAGNLGGDIFIHGACVTIGCLPMTDDKIKEIYLLAAYAKNNGQRNIPVYIFPFDMTDKNMKLYEQTYAANDELINFWKNLKTGYDLFHQDGKPLNISILKNGDYAFN